MQQGSVAADGSAPPPSRTSLPRRRRKQAGRASARTACGTGCQVDYLIESNVGLLHYHREAPVFHEGAKKWVCCGVTKFDFDDFLAVPGCCRGMHEPVE